MINGYILGMENNKRDREMEHFLTAVNAVAPFLVYMTFGYGVKISGFIICIRTVE